MLQEFSKYWERIDVIAPRGPGAVETTVHGNVTVHPGNVLRPLQPLFILKKGTEIYQRRPFDLINIHTYPYFYNDIGGRLLHHRLGVPYMLDLMHIIGYPRAVDLDERVRRVLTRLYFTYFARDMLGIRVINHQEVPEFLRRCGVPADKLYPLPCFYIDFDVFRPLDLPKTGRRVLYAGRLARNKGLFEFVFRLSSFVLTTDEGCGKIQPLNSTAEPLSRHPDVGRRKKPWIWTNPTPCDCWKPWRPSRRPPRPTWRRGWGWRWAPSTGT